MLSKLINRIKCAWKGHPMNIVKSLLRYDLNKLTCSCEKRIYNFRDYGLTGEDFAIINASYACTHEHKPRKTTRKKK
jgi:hypothetical protein